MNTSLMPVLEQDMTMYEMSPLWSHSLVLFYSLSFTHSLTQASLPQQTSPDLNAWDISHITRSYSTSSQLRNVFVSYYFLEANEGFNMKCCIPDGVYLLQNPMYVAFKPLHNEIEIFFDNSTFGFAQLPFFMAKAPDP